jgi:hypothetical protein
MSGCEDFRSRETDARFGRLHTNVRKETEAMKTVKQVVRCTNEGCGSHTTEDAEGLIWWMKVGLALAEPSYVCSRTWARDMLDSLYQPEHPEA